MGEENVTRKLAAILYADVAGYSRLTGADEEATHRALSASLDAITAVIEDQGGRVLHYAGDAILAEFASVVVAVTCAIDIQRDLAARNHGLPHDRKLQFRIGVNLGDVIVDRGELYGDGVNVAARLESLAEPGGICISRKVLHEVRDKLEVGFEFLGDQSVKNIESPIPIYRVLMDPAAAGKVIGETRFRTSSKPLVAGLVGVVAVAVAVLWWQPWRMPSPPVPAEQVSLRTGNPSIAILPFDNISGDPQQEYFSDGITEDLITGLSKISGLDVIARTSTFFYKDQSVDIREIAKKLNARFVVEGSVRKVGEQVRINAQLIDAETGHHMWAERYDGKIGNIFALQDKISEKIISALAVRLAPAERSNLVRRAPKSIKAYDYFLQGRNLFMRFSKKDTYLARNFYNKALKLDSDFAEAYAMLAWTYAFEFMNGWSQTPQKTLDSAIELADKSTSLVVDLPVAYFVRGLVYRERRKYVKALAEAQKAIEFDPNYPNAYVLLATLYYYRDQPEEGLKLLEKASRINPIHPSNYPFHMGQAFFILKRYDEAITAFKRGLEQNPTSQRLRVWLAATYAQVGRQEDAEWEADQIFADDPNFSLQNMTQIFPFKDPADLEHFMGALRKVGFEKS